MADWDELIAEVTNKPQKSVSEVKETAVRDVDDFSFGDALEKSMQKKVDLAIAKAELDPLKIRPVLPKEKAETAGEKWFNIPKAKLSEEDIRDWKLLKMRSVLHRGGANAVELPEDPPDFVQFGVILDNPMEGKKGRLDRKLRAPTIAESLAKDFEYREYLESNYEKIAKVEKRSKKARGK